MNTRQMEYILAIVETRNFNRAAEALYISQPTLTYQIKLVEKEIGFKLFDRSFRGITLTPAGEQFITTVRNVLTDLKIAVEQGQNVSRKYTQDIRIVEPIRSALPLLPRAIEAFEAAHPHTSVTPGFDWYNGLTRFLKGEYDIIFDLYENVRQIPDINVHPLFSSKIYLITRTDDPLAGKELIHENDLAGRTLMVGGPSPEPLRAVQKRVVTHVECSHFNSESHDMSLTYVASKRAIVLAPGFLHEHTDDFCWTPFDCTETIPCVLCTHKEDKREEVKELVESLVEMHKTSFH
jgi:DNA-binding transcriptional LysR family regulator